MNVVFNSEAIGIMIGPGPAVCGVSVGGAAELAGVILGMPLVHIGEYKVSGWPARKCLDVVRSLPRPLTIEFGSAKRCRVSEQWLMRRVDSL